MAISALKVALRQLQGQNTLSSGLNNQGKDPFAQALQEAETRAGNAHDTQAQTAARTPADYIRQLSSQLGPENGIFGKAADVITGQHLDMIKELARLQIMSLNQSLMDAFSDDTGSRDLGIGNSFMSVMAGLLQTVQSPPPPPPSTIPKPYQTRTVVQPENPAGTLDPPLMQPEKVEPETPLVLTEPGQKDDTGPQTVEAVKTVEAPEEPKPFLAASASEKETRDVFDIIKDTASKYGLDPNLVKAVVKTESNFNPKAVSSVGAMGLMQLMPQTAAGLGVEDAFDPEQNVDGGAKYLKQMLDRYHGKIDHALAAYNWGPGNFDRSRGGNLPRETRNYIRIVNQHLKKYSASDQA